jgi:hypothetical protein
MSARERIAHATRVLQNCAHDGAEVAHVFLEVEHRPRAETKLEIA